MANNQSRQQISGNSTAPGQAPTVRLSQNVLTGKMSQGEPSRGTAMGAGTRFSAGTESSPNPQKSGKRLTAIIVVLCVIVAIAVWLAIWLFACNGSSLFDPNAQTGQAPYKTDEEVQAELNRVVEEGMFNISIASNISFENGTAPGTAYIENVPGNHYLMKVAITEDSTGEQLYESGVLQPNQYIEEIVLSNDLEPGVYDATATFLALDPTTYEEMGQAAAKITLNVQG